MASTETLVTTLTPDVIRDRIEGIGKLLYDPEVAQGKEYSLFLDVLSAVAEGTCADPAACARAALAAAELEFPRW